MSSRTAFKSPVPGNQPHPSLTPKIEFMQAKIHNNSAQTAAVHNSRGRAKNHQNGNGRMRRVFRLGPMTTVLHLASSPHTCSHCAVQTTPNAGNQADGPPLFPIRGGPIRVSETHRKPLRAEPIHPLENCKGLTQGEQERIVPPPVLYITGGLQSVSDQQIHCQTSPLPAHALPEATCVRSHAQTNTLEFKRHCKASHALLQNRKNPPLDSSSLATPRPLSSERSTQTRKTPRQCSQLCCHQG